MNYCSKIDNKSSITEDEWAVTLVNKTDTKGNISYSINHAQIIVEGIKDKEYFIKLAHLTAGKTGCNQQTLEHGCTWVFSTQAEVKTETLAGHRVYPLRTPTWIRPREKVQIMWSKIELEENSQKAGDHDCLFTLHLLISSDYLLQTS